MIQIAQTVERTLSIATSLAQAKALLCNPHEQAKLLSDLDRLEPLGGDCYRFVFRPVEVASFRFLPTYAARYQTAEEGCTWTPLPDESMRSRGRIVIRAGQPGRVEVHYREDIECDLEIGRVLGVVVAPIARELLRKSIAGYLERSRATLERAGSGSGGREGAQPRRVEP